MLPRTPRLAIRALLTAFQQRDVDAVLALYENNALMVVHPNMIATGRSSLRKVYEGIFSLSGDSRFEEQRFIEGDDLALFSANLAMASNPVTETHLTTMVLRKQPDGSWLIAMDNPWGPRVASRIS